MLKSKSESLFKEALNLIPGGVNSPVRACGSVGGEPIFIEKGEKSNLFDADGNKYIDYVLSWGPLILGHRPACVIDALKKVLETGTSFGAPAGSGVATLDIPGSPGVPKSVISNTLSLKFNDIEGFIKIMEEKGDKVAGVIVEPVAGNMGMIPPKQGFLETLREYTLKSGSVLIFDEVMTGFRVAQDCAQGLFNITPDLTCFGKVIGGGLPVGAYGGRKDIMDNIAPVGKVYQAGTLSGNPLAMAAGIATLTELQNKSVYDELDKKTQKLMNGFQAAADNAGINFKTNHVGSMAGFFFSNEDIFNFDDAKSCDLDRFAKFYKIMLDKGVYLAPSQFEACFVSLAHSDDDIEKTIIAAQEAMSAL